MKRHTFFIAGADTGPSRTVPLRARRRSPRGEPAPVRLPFMRLALRLARRGRGTTSPNPMVGAVLVKNGRIIGRGWHRRAGGPHAEIEALRDAQQQGHTPRGATLFVTLEPCCTQGRTPPCTKAIIAAGIQRVVVGTADPNPRHAGRGFTILRRAGIEVIPLGHFLSRSSAPRSPSRRAKPVECQPGQRIAEACQRLNEAFNHWIVHRTPLVTVKAAMTLDGKIATAEGASKWITGERARAWGMKLRQGSDAILVGINTVLADDPSLTCRPGPRAGRNIPQPRLRRIILDSLARTPLTAKVVCDEHAALTTVIVSRSAPKNRVAALAKRVRVMVAPRTRSWKGNAKPGINPAWLVKQLGAEHITSLLVEGGGEVNASFLLQGHAHRVAFFYAPKILGGRDARKAVAGDGARSLREAVRLEGLCWRRLGPDWLLEARVRQVVRVRPRRRP